MSDHFYKFNKLLKKKESSQDVMRYLIKLPEVIHTPNDDGWLPLHFACWFGDSSDVIKILLEAYPKAAKVQLNNG